MFTWIKTIGEGKPDHPLFDTKEAKKFLDDLPENDPLAALDEISSWLTSVKDTPGFRPDVRASVIMLLDETGQPLQAKLLEQFLKAPGLHNFQGTPPWQAIHSFMQAATEAYSVCVQEHQLDQAEKDTVPAKERLAVLYVRLLRAAGEQMKLQLMRYQMVEQSVWQHMYEHYSIAEAAQIAGTMVQAYPTHPGLSSAQRELVRALILHISSPTTLALEQIETVSRITGRLAGLFDFKKELESDCSYVIDLSRPGAPDYVDDKVQPTETMRYFGGVKALPKVEEIIQQYEQSFFNQGRGLKDEFAPDGKLTVLRHARICWSGKKRLRQQDRHRTSADIQIAHGFETVSRLVKSFELTTASFLSNEDAAMLKKKSEMALARDGTYYTPETWPMQNMSSNGIGGLIPKTAGDWVKVGRVCGVKMPGSPLWGVGMLRRIQIETKGEVRTGIKIFSQRPLSVWLRSHGEGADQAANWESAGSLAYTYLPVILVQDAQDLFVNATMLMESGSYTPDAVYEMMMGQKVCNIKLTGLLEEGEDYEQVSFQWL